ncbi:Hypothetical_protein [Hexamita inflata]|uniref:Hypothetical_protein n=1 Tax=Hexamita inflata TaxID=28002 RepID=A0AA86PY65_9EUKA|nr:Hypothetical protein HINF_LOCUS36079 [Hexamita inflata]
MSNILSQVRKCSSQMLIIQLADIFSVTKFTNGFRKLMLLIWQSSRNSASSLTNYVSGVKSSNLVHCKSSQVRFIKFCSGQIFVNKVVGQIEHFQINQLFKTRTVVNLVHVKNESLQFFAFCKIFYVFRSVLARVQVLQVN